jgi:hypothetical protein
MKRPPSSPPQLETTVNASPPAKRTRRSLRPNAHVGVARSPTAPGSLPAQDGQRLPMPNERDERPGEVNPEPQDVMVQAKKDLDAGLVDTDMRATGGLDDAHRRDLLRRAR